MNVLRPTRVLVAAALLILVAGCGSDDPASSEPSPSGAASSTPSDPSGSDSSSTDYGFDTSKVGDDLLGRVRQGTVKPGAPAKVSFLVPESYDGNIGLSGLTSKADGITYGLTLEYVPGKTPSEAGAAAKSSDPNTKLTAYDIEINSRPFTVIVAGDDSASSRVFLFGDGDSSYALRFDADAPLSDVPDSKVEEIHQAVASLEVEPA